MRPSLLILLIPIGLGGCISYSGTPPPQRETVVLPSRQTVVLSPGETIVPAGSATVVCTNGLSPPC